MAACLLYLPASLCVHAFRTHIEFFKEYIFHHIMDIISDIYHHIIGNGTRFVLCPSTFHEWLVLLYQMTTREHYWTES